MVQDALFVHPLCQNNELIFVQMHLSPVLQLTFGAASGNLTMVPVSSVTAFLKVFFCSDFPVHCSTVNYPPWAQIVPAVCLCSSLPTLSVSLCASLLRSFRKEHSELQMGSHGLTEPWNLGSPFPQPALAHLIPSWPDQLLHSGALYRKDKLTLASFEDPTALGVWKTTANKACFCYLPQTELKRMTERIMPH